MNTVNNKRRRNSIEKIETAFMRLLETAELQEISVAQLCKLTALNRSTFYANYMDIYDLADKLRHKLEKEFSELFSSEKPAQIQDGALRMFTHIQNNQLFYKTYFKLCYNDNQLIWIYDQTMAEQHFHNKNMKYHIQFFRNGLNAIIRLWLAGGCQESPEEMVEILKEEYRGRTLIP